MSHFRIKKAAGNSEDNAQYFYAWMSRVGYDNKKVIDENWNIKDSSTSLALARIVLHFEPNNKFVSKFVTKIEVWCTLPTMVEKT